MLHVNGLRIEVQTNIEGFIPFTVIDAFHLGCIYEYNVSNPYTVNDIVIFPAEITAKD